MRRLETANVVVVAQQFNPSILSEIWLAKHGIVPEGAKTGEWLLTNQVVKIGTTDFIIMAIPERLQFTPVNATGDVQGLIEEKMGGIVDLLPHTPYSAVGLNFEWIVTTTDLAQFASRLRQEFTNENAPLYDAFREEDARFGAYLSKNVLRFRMGVNILPISGKTDDSPIEGLQYRFNFTRELVQGDPVEQIHGAIRRWTEARDLSEEIFERTAGWIEDEH
jgi:hypothetical protein